MALANIVSNTEINLSDDFNVVNSIDNIVEGLPTLIIGFENVKKLYPEFDVTSNKVKDKVFWTFKKNEKRDRYEEDLKWFVKKIYVDLVNEISYVFVDPIQYKGQTLIKIVRKIYRSKKIISYEDENMIYIYADKIIFGIDLKLFKYIGMNTDKIKSTIKSISSVFLLKNEILIEYKNIMSVFNNKNRYLPYLYLIKNEKNNTSSVLHISRKS